ncbi:HD domain-containing phosphohydrolase [Rhodoferax sp.]|uniref:HD domain-containing phosphohydrolase n=1 Tax=Rhodoferax sp. TaxID=50421 RepID=UPI00374D64C8
MSSEPIRLPYAASHVAVIDAVRALAFVGDLSMGQPVDHSLRTAWIASRLAAALGRGAEQQRHCHDVALLRWSGCTANAPEVSELMGDDVLGRREMLATSGRSLPASMIAAIGKAGGLSDIHCEVSGDVAHRLGLAPVVERALRHIFERCDGPATDIPIEVFLVAAAGDLEIFSRIYGIERALALIKAKADTQYPAALVDVLQQHAADWLHSLEQGEAGTDLAAVSISTSPSAPLELIADVIDLKLPWLTGFSRKVAGMARGCAAALGGAEEQQQRLYRAGLIHGLGRASVPNHIWDAASPPGEGAAELLRLVPYWTARAVRRIGSLSAEAEIASFVDERLDGSGFFRGASGAAISTECQVLAVAAHWVLLQTSRPGRPALDPAQATARMQAEVAQGRFAADIVAALTGQATTSLVPPTRVLPAAEALALSSREVEVLSRISHGESNKEAARALGISPSTVRAHLENVFRKLGCSTRAAATLKAMHLGLFTRSA